MVWFRGADLRVHDHLALHAACRDSRELIPVFVLDPAYLAKDPPWPAPHRVQFLLTAVEELAQELAARGSELQLVHGPASTRIPELVAQLQVERVFAIGSCEPRARARDARIARELAVPFELCELDTLLDPASVKTGSGTAFRVYTPFSRAALSRLSKLQPLAAPKQLPPLPSSLRLKPVKLPTLKSLGITPNPELQPGGERAGRERLRVFLAGPVADYETARDRMDVSGTSRLSADLHFGTLSARSVWSALDRPTGLEIPRQSHMRYRAELLWREFSHYTLWHHPSVLEEPFRPEFHDFPWRDGREAESDFEAWWHGRTGYPVVDAAARQLLREGFVHNRARMISASFLTKHLLINYQRGEALYLQLLTDGDLAQNNLGWQWSAGCGCDAQPYFRIFNPVTQGERFDPQGAYVRRLVPELARLPVRYIHAPWLAPESVLKQAGVRLGETYPRPIVEHAAGRQRFMLVASEHIKAMRARGAGGQAKAGAAKGGKKRALPTRAKRKHAAVEA
ncbi:MAG: deoxyribodipyrimidine photo-lyase [Polyangiales bacterium]